LNTAALRRKKAEAAMNYDHPAIIDQLASEYVLGTMNQRVRRRYTKHLLTSFAAQRAVAQWHTQLQPWNNAIQPVPPPPHVWQAITRRTRPAPPAQSWRDSLQAWFGPLMRPALGLCLGALITVGVVRQAPELVGMEPPLQTLPASYVGVLSDADGNAGLAVSSLRRGTIVSLKMIKPLAKQANQVAVLWALPANGAPVRIGVVGATGKSEIILTGPAEVVFSTVSKLGVTLEADKAASAPSGPFVLKGNCVKVW
jgi:anti-sigma-K factor RskA